MELINQRRPQGFIEGMEFRPPNVSLVDVAITSNNPNNHEPQILEDPYENLVKFVCFALKGSEPNVVPDLLEWFVFNYRRERIVRGFDKDHEAFVDEVIAKTRTRPAVDQF
jgi:hypothetical protein